MGNLIHGFVCDFSKLATLRKNNTSTLYYLDSTYSDYKNKRKNYATCLVKINSD